MKSLLSISTVLLIAATPALGQNNFYGWTISSSSSNPDVNSGPVNPQPFSLYLWFKCSASGGMSAAEFDFAAPEGVLNFGFSPMNGFLNAGSASHLLLAVGGCPTGPVVAGSWVLFGQTPGDFCLVSSANGYRVTVDCSAPNPQLRAIDAVGYAYGGAIPSCLDLLCTHVHCWCWYCDTIWGFGCIFAPNFPCPCPNGPEICDGCKTVGVEATSWGRTKSLYR